MFGLRLTSTTTSEHERASSERRQPRRRQRWLRRGAAALTGLLLAASRPGLDWGALAFVGLVPLLLAVRGQRVRTATSLGFIAGCCYYASVVSWSRYFGTVAIVPFAVVLGSYWAGACAAIAAIPARRSWQIAGVPAAWVAFEGLVSRWPFGGFSWGELGYAMHNIAPMRSLAAAGGIPLVSFVVVLVNVMIASALRGDRSARLRLACGAVALIVAVAMWFVAWPRMHATGQLRVAMLQGNDINRDLTDAEIASFTLPRQHFTLADSLRGRYDLIVFPESAFHPQYINDPLITSRLIEYAHRFHAAVLANGIADASDNRVLNRDVLYDRNGTLQGTYEKRHLVPFGEWVPWRSTLQRYIHALDRIPRDFQPGTQSGVFTVDGHRIATLICFESAFAPLARAGANAGAQLLVVSTNNRSYRRSANSAQHIALGQMRAAETGREVLHASVSGATAVIDDRGAVRYRTQMFHNEAVTTEAITRSGSTLYMRTGDWALWASCGCTLLAFAASLRRKLRARAPSTLAAVMSSAPSTAQPNDE